MQKPQHLSLIAVWQLLSAAASLIGILGSALILVMVFNGHHIIPWLFFDPFLGSISMGEVVVVFIGLGFLFMIVYFLLSLIAGIGSLQGKSWARGLGIIHAVLSIPNFPVGTVIGVLIIAYLGKPEVSDYFNNQKGPGGYQPVLSPAGANQ